MINRWPDRTSWILPGFCFSKPQKERHLIASLTISALFLVCMIFDLRDHKVPFQLTVSAMVGSGVYALLRGVWSPVLLMATLTHVSDFLPREKRLFFAFFLSVFAAIFQPAHAMVCALILGVWLMWEFGKMGGADVKLIMAAALTLGTPLIVIPISLAGGVQGMIALLRKQKEIPFVVSIFAGTIIFTLYPYAAHYLGNA